MRRTFEALDNEPDTAREPARVNRTEVLRHVQRRYMILLFVPRQRPNFRSISKKSYTHE